MADGTTPLAQAYHAYEQLEGRLSTALDQLVTTNGFADLLATSATNVMAMTRLANGSVDRIVRSTRLAARQDVTELARQLARTEDKLERLLQAVELLQERLDTVATDGADQGAVPTTAPTTPSTTPSTTAPAAPATATVNGRVSRARATASTARRGAGARPGAAGTGPT